MYEIKFHIFSEPGTAYCTAEQHVDNARECVQSIDIVFSDNATIVENLPSGLNTPTKRLIRNSSIDNHRTVILNIHLPEMPKMSNMSELDK